MRFRVFSGGEGGDGGLVSFESSELPRHLFGVFGGGAGGGGGVVSFDKEFGTAMNCTNSVCIKGKRPPSPLRGWPNIGLTTRYFEPLNIMKAGAAKGPVDEGLWGGAVSGHREF
jgi:hypothetical protein